MRVGTLGLITMAVALATAGVDGQTRKPRTTQKPAPAAKAAAPAKPVRGPADVTCPSVLGAGVITRRQYCDVLIGRNPAEGIVVRIPPHKGPATLSFDLHNRHTYSAEQEKAGRGFAAYTATIGILTRDGELLTRAVVRSEFRTARDLIERIGGGAGPGGVKAVAPTGTEPIVVEIPEGVTEVSLLGEKLSVVRVEGSETFSSAGRPIAVVSALTVEYTPAPAKPSTQKKEPEPVGGHTNHARSAATVR